MDFNNIIDKYRQISFSERDKGTRFERLMQGYLQTDPKYSPLFQNVWLWSEFPSKSDFGRGDLGIDIVTKTHDGEYWAVQCKCFQSNHVTDKPSVDTFLSTSSREFTDEGGKKSKFSVRLWISTTNHWGPNATESIKNQSPPVVRINLFDLMESPIDWEKLENGIHGEQARTSNRTLRAHQQKSLELTHEHFKTNDRGKLIMACGTGKTFNSLRIAEYETNGKGVVLFLVPSIALMGQTLREWTTFSLEPIHPICICSDPDISRSKKKNEDGDGFSVIDLAYPASTYVPDIISQFRLIRKKNDGLTVVFSTYQSIEVISKVQKELGKEFPELNEFDMIICDEAHRTTGVTLSGEDESSFTKVHDNGFIKSKKRLYMTATPRLYSDDTKSKAAQNDAVLCSMDDTSLYGEEIYRIGFGEAVEKDLLTDYKVLILTLSEQDVPPAIQRMIADGESEINSDDASKLIGCINALSKQVLGDNGLIKESDPDPMRRAVAFCQNISTSKKISSIFNTATESYISSLPDERRGEMVTIESRHIDGTMSAPTRDEMLGWLKSSSEDRHCRILTNVRVLSEGVDVPSLDAVLFLSARNSQVDVVQSVGRVMRKSPNKKYGYIIIPVVVPSSVDASKALDDNERFKVVWTVLNALRAHDDRFNATVNKIELNKKKPSNILVGGSTNKWNERGEYQSGSDDDYTDEQKKDISNQITLQFEQLQHVVFARMVEKVGDRRYWEQWAKNVAEIAERQVVRIKRLVHDGGKHEQDFNQFLQGLRNNINPSISTQEAIDMLSQHIITKPVFDALFEGYSFVNHNPVSVSMQRMLDSLEEESLEKDTETLDKFYQSVKMRAQGIDNAEGRQKIIIELYDKFFKSAFPKMVEKLGIVYTPIEVVDFIIHSVNDILKKEFGRGLTDENIHILDPFTGTGTFITRLLQSGMIEEKDLERKYKHEIHANEIVLLAYYIAAINIENAYHDATPNPNDGIGTNDYTPFDGIVLTDTFQLGETDDSKKLFSEMFPQNSKRVQRQRKSPLRVIVGNPPYSVGQKSTNDNAQNQSYFNLDKRISNTYGNLSGSTNMNALYDSYIKSFRWSTDRLDKNGGIICFVTNGSWLDGNSTDGFRKTIEREFSSIYVFNLRGNARTTGEKNRKEGHPLFGATGGSGGSKTPISITLLVKNPTFESTKAVIKYHDIGDYLKRNEKLFIIKNFKSISNPDIPWKILEPNEHGDWISQRNESFNTFTPIEPEKKFTPTSTSFFTLNSLGSTTNRDAWSYGSAKNKVNVNIKRLIEFYNQQVDSYIELSKTKSKIDINEFIDRNPLKISWTSSLIPKVERRIFVKFEENKTIESLYRPFFKQKLYFGEHLVHRRGQFEEFFPEPYTKPNFVIFISGVGVSGDFSCLISKCVTDGQILQNGQCFPLYYYEENKKSQKSMFDVDSGTVYVRRDGISDFILQKSHKQYGSQNITKEDIFYYVYGFLHSPEYRETFANDLKKMLPRLPLVDDVRDFWSFSKSGRELSELHLNYETVPPYEGVNVIGEDSGYYRVEKMRFLKKDRKDTIIFNSRITIERIPNIAYEYVVNGKSAIEWIMERYQITTHKESGITNDPNDWCDEVGNPRYILDLLLSIITVSMKTVGIVRGLPKIKFE